MAPCVWSLGDLQTLSKRMLRCIGGAKLSVGENDMCALHWLGYIIHFILFQHSITVYLYFHLCLGMFKVQFGNSAWKKTNKNNKTFLHIKPTHCS